MFFSFWVRQPVKEKENSEFKPVVFHLRIDLVPYPACDVVIQAEKLVFNA